jgi:hypothetical protein
MPGMNNGLNPDAPRHGQDRHRHHRADDRPRRHRAGPGHLHDHPHNLAWAFCYNIAAIPLAALGFLNPLLAAATMTLSSVFVVWNSLGLRRFAAHP